MAGNFEQQAGVLECGGSPPKVFFWFKMYAGLLSLIYLVMVAFSLVFFLADPQDLDMPKTFALLIGMLFLGLGLVLFIACLLPFFLPPKPWVWIYNLVIICVGMTSACFLPICVPLLIYWLKPEAKAYFGRA